MNEDWKTSTKYPFLAFSNLGRVYNLKTEKFKKTRTEKRRPFVVCSVYDEKTKQSQPILVAKMIATLFVENPYNKKYVNYKDGDFTNVNADNLFWSNGVNQYVVNPHRFHPNLKPAKKVRCIETLEMFDSVKEIAESLSISKVTVYNSIKRKQKIKSLGLSFEYAE